MSQVLIVKAGTTLPEIAARRGDFEDWIASAMELAVEQVRVVSVYEGDSLPPADSVEAIVITGSRAMVSERETWSERTAEWIRAALEVPVPLLGICYGHQLLAHAAGGVVGRNPAGRQIGTVAVEPQRPAADDDLLSELPAQALLHFSHVESVLELPPGAVALAASARDVNTAFSLGPRAWGVQFHPEFDADVMRGYLRGRRAILESEGLDPDALLQATAESPWGEVVMRRFAAIISGA